ISSFVFFFFFQAEDGIRDDLVTGVQTCALPISYLCTRSSAFRVVVGKHCPFGRLRQRQSLLREGRTNFYVQLKKRAGLKSASSRDRKSVVWERSVDTEGGGRSERKRHYTRGRVE